MARFAIIACFTISAMCPAVARADGAFPDSLSILTPADQPHDTFLATNFGLLISGDDAQTWQWVCEEEKTTFAFQHQLGAPPRRRLYALSAGRLVFSDDRGCTWTVAAPPRAGMSVLDAFPDPTSQDRVLAIALDPSSDAGIIGAYEVIESSDGGATFPTVRYAAAPGDTLTGIEIARARPATLYATLISGSSFVPKLARSTDAGAHWELVDLRAALGADVDNVRLIAIDPADPGKVLLRVLAASGDRLAVTSDAGDSFHTALTLPGGRFSSFARLDSGTLVVSGTAAGIDPVAFRSRDGGGSFQPLPAPPSLRGLSARGPWLYGVADNAIDGYAIGVSADEGETWTPIMRYDDIQAISSCVSAQCQEDCQMRAEMGYWEQALCSATPAPKPVDGGAGGSDGAADARDAAPDGGAGGQGGAGSGGGCGCAIPGAPRPAAGVVFLFLLACLVLRRRAR